MDRTIRKGNPGVTSTVPHYDDPDRVQEPITRDILDAAVLRMENTLRGNGLDPASVRLTYFEGEILNFEARSWFEIKSTRTEKTLPGKETRGEICASASDLHSKINQTISRTTFNRDLVMLASDFLDARKDKGFSVNNLVLRLERLDKVFIYYITCPSCTGGQINCKTCQGAGSVNCTKCRGHRTIVCPMCRGTRVARNHSTGQTDTCRKCNGHGESPCLACKTTGKASCAACHGSGKAGCQRCAASGSLSEVGYVTFEGKTHCTFDPEPLPPELPELILQRGPTLVTEGHADVEILREKEQGVAQQEFETTEKTPQKNKLIVPYYIRLPYGQIRFQIGDQDEMTGKLFGLHPRLLNFPPFLEDPIRPGMDRLIQAANHPRSARSNVLEAIRFRVIGDALIFAATLPPKKAALRMRKKWSLGLLPETLDYMIRLSIPAFANLTKMPRLAGLLGGLVLAGTLDAAYLLLGRPHLTLHPYAFMALDAVIVLGGGHLALLLAQFIAKTAVRDVFSVLLPPEKAKAIMPRAGHYALLAYGGALVVFAGVIAACYASGAAIPVWAIWLKTILY